MEYDYEALRVKEEELRALAESGIPARIPDRRALAAWIIETYIELSPPEKETPYTSFVTVKDQGRGGGKSRKPGNLRLNWRKLWPVLPESVIGGTTIAATPWLAPFVLLLLASTIWENSSIELSPAHAVTLLTMWRHADGQRRIPEDHAYEVARKAASESGLQPLNAQMFADILQHLSSLQSIAVEEGIIHLKELVEEPYY